MVAFNSPNSLFNSKALMALLMVMSLGLAGCGAGGEASDSSAQADEVTSGNDEETNDGGNQEPVEPEPEETYTLNLLSQPGNVTITTGESHTFSVSVEHDLPITVTWYRNGSVVQNSSSTSLLVNTAGSYDCAVSDGTQSVDCDAFTLTLEALQFVTINSQPSNQMVSEGMDVTLSVGAVGSGTLSYQWYFDGAALNGETGSSLNLSDVTVADAGDYYVIVSQGGVSETSSTAQVDVAAVVSGSALISWDRPTTRTDDSDLGNGEIESYEIYHADSADGAMAQIDSVDAADLEYVANGLSEGTHYFSLVTVDTSGMRSALSTRVSITIN